MQAGGDCCFGWTQPSPQRHRQEPWPGHGRTKHHSGNLDMALRQKSLGWACPSSKMDVRYLPWLLIFWNATPASHLHGPGATSQLEHISSLQSGERPESVFIYSNQSRGQQSYVQTGSWVQWMGSSEEQTALDTANESLWALCRTVVLWSCTFTATPQKIRSALNCISFVPRVRERKKGQQ